MKPKRRPPEPGLPLDYEPPPSEPPAAQVRAMLKQWSASHAAANAPFNPRRQRPRCPATPLEVWERLAETDPIIARELAQQRAELAVIREAQRNQAARSVESKAGTPSPESE